MPNNFALIRSITRNRDEAHAPPFFGKLAGENSQRKFLTFLKACRNFSLGLLFPAHCVICRKPLDWLHSGPVCSICWMKVRSIQEPICFRCGYPIVAEIGDAPAKGIYCASCRLHSPVFTQARSVYYYEGVLRQLVHCFKYQGKVQVGRMLAHSLVEYCRPESPFSSAECVIPVPLGIKKLRHREFNQSFILAKAIGKYLGVSIYPFALKRIKEPGSQMELSRQERMQNVQGAFKVRKKKEIYKKEVLLVDDVFTTGATISECSRVLLQNGVKKVWVLTLARTILH